MAAPSLADVHQKLELLLEYQQSKKLDQMLCVLRGIEKALTVLEAQGKKIMSAISDFAVKQREHNAKISTAMTDLAGDIQSLNDKITELQNNPGPISPQDQATLDELQSEGLALADALAAVAAIHPPTPPPG